MSRAIDRLVFYGCARRVLVKEVVASPVPGRSDGPGHEAAPTVWTNIAQHPLDTVSAKRTFIGADACFRGVGRQDLVAVLTGRSEFQHMGVSIESYGGGCWPTPGRRIRCGIEPAEGRILI